MCPSITYQKCWRETKGSFNHPFVFWMQVRVKRQFEIGYWWIRLCSTLFNVCCAVWTCFSACSRNLRRSTSKTNRRSRCGHSWLCPLFGMATGIATSNASIHRGPDSCRNIWTSRPLSLVLIKDIILGQDRGGSWIQFNSRINRAINTFFILALSRYPTLVPHSHSFTLCESKCLV